MEIHLHSKYFTLKDNPTTFKYSGPLADFLFYLNISTIPPYTDIFKPSDYSNGTIPITIHDHRHNTKYPVVLYPSPTSIYSDLNDEFSLESHLLLHLNPTLNIAVNHDITLDIQQSNLSHYNSVKFNQASIKASQTFFNSEKDDHTHNLLSYMAEKKDFIPQFNQLNFIQEWKQKKHNLDTDIIHTLGDTNPILHLRKKQKKQNINSPGTPAINTNTHTTLLNSFSKKCTRTLKFEQEFNKIKMYTILNIYEQTTNEYEAILRWGTVDGTSIDGSMLRYPLGNKIAVEYYIGHFKGFYGITHRLVFDSNTLKGLAKLSSMGSDSQLDEKVSVASASDQDSIGISEKKIVKLKVSKPKK